MRRSSVRFRLSAPYLSIVTAYWFYPVSRFGLLAEFGKFCRKLRIDQGELLKEMADKLGVSAAYLSAGKVGHRNCDAANETSNSWICPFNSAFFGFENALMFPIVHLIEFVLLEKNPGFALDIREEEMGILRGKNCHAFAWGHFLLPTPGRVGHARLTQGTSIEAVRDPEMASQSFCKGTPGSRNLVRGMSMLYS